MKRITTVMVAVLLGGLGLIGPARATIPSPTDCEAEPNHATLLTSPLLVQYGYRTGDKAFVEGRVCVATTGSLSGVAYQAVGVAGQPFGTPGPLTCPYSGNQYTGYGVGGSSSGNGFTGGVGVATAPQLCNLGDGTYQLIVPFVVCSGGTCPVDSTENIFKTGVVIGTFGTTPPPTGTSTGAGIYQAGVEIWIDGVRVPLDAPGAAAGANTGAITPAVSTTGGTICVVGACVPAASLAYNGQSLAAVSVLGVTAPVVIPGGQQCLFSEGHTTNYPCP